MDSPTFLIIGGKVSRPAHMLGDELISGATWGDLEQAWRSVASPANRLLVAEVVTALWKQSAVMGDAETLRQILSATLLLSGRECLLGEAAMT